MITVLGAYVYKFTSKYCDTCSDVAPGKNRCLTFPFLSALFNSYILILPGILSLKIGMLSFSSFDLVASLYVLWPGCFTICLMALIFRKKFDFLDVYQQ